MRVNASWFALCIILIVQLLNFFSALINTVWWSYLTSSRPWRSVRRKFSPNPDRIHCLCTRNSRLHHASNPKLKNRSKTKLLWNGKFTDDQGRHRSINESRWFPYLENGLLIAREGECAGFRCSNRNKRTKGKSEDGWSRFHTRDNGTSWPLVKKNIKTTSS